MSYIQTFWTKECKPYQCKIWKKTGTLLSTHGVDICQHCLAAKNVSNKNTRKKVLKSVQKVNVARKYVW